MKNHDIKSCGEKIPASAALAKACYPRHFPADISIPGVGQIYYHSKASVHAGHEREPLLVCQIIHDRFFLSQGKQIDQTN
jgi:hypothetical protein